MPLHRLIDEFDIYAKKCLSCQELFATSEAIAHELGFPGLAMVHGLALRFPDSRLIWFDNFNEWAEIFVAKKYYLDCPVLRACQRTNLPFGWAELGDHLLLTKRHERVMHEAARHGFRNGFTVPVGVIGEPLGCCTFSTDRTELPSIWRCRAAAMIGALAFAAARRLYGFPARAKEVPQLSRRKLECLRYCALGKTDGEIATILGIREPTVRTYMAMLRKDFDVVARSQLTAVALRLGCVGYDDAIPSSY